MGDPTSEGGTPVKRVTIQDQFRSCFEDVDLTLSNMVGCECWNRAVDDDKMFVLTLVMNDDIFFLLS
jgi:hypothetical protein